MNIKKLIDVQGFTRTVNGKIQYVRRHGRNQNIQSLTGEELNAIRSYSGNVANFINPLLNGNLPIPPKIQTTINLLDNALDKLPNYIPDQPLIRTIRLDRSEFENILKNDYLITRGYFSTSKTPRNPYNIMYFNNQGTDSDSVNLLFEINSTGGKDISKIGFNAQEEEVLFPRGTVFQLGNMETDELLDYVDADYWDDFSKLDELGDTTVPFYRISLEDTTSTKAKLLSSNRSNKYNRQQLSMLRRLAINNNDNYLRGRSELDKIKRREYYNKGLEELINRDLF